MSARAEKVRAKLAELRPDLAHKVQTGARGQLVLFPAHQAQSEGHAWRFQGADPRHKERHYLCAHCGELRILAGALELFGASRSPKEPACKR